MFKQKNKPAGKVIELNSEWQQVGGLLGNVIGNLQVKKARVRPETQPSGRLQAAGAQQQSAVLFAPRKAA